MADEDQAKAELDAKAASLTAEEEVKPDESGAAPAAEQAEKEKVPAGLQKRINQITREKHEARQKNAELEARIAELESKPKSVTETDAAPRPKEDDFDSDADFQSALIEHAAEVATEKALKKVREENDSRDQTTRKNEAQTALQAKKTAFEANVDAKRENFEDFDEVAYGHQFMDLDLADQIFGLDKGPEVAYHLGSHLDEAERIFALPPIQRARELTKLEFQVEELKPKMVSGAPDAIKPLGNQEKAVENPDDMSADDWQKWRNEQVGLISDR